MLARTTSAVEMAASKLESLDRTSHETIQELLDIDSRTRKSLFPWRGQFSPQLVEFLIGEQQHDQAGHFHILDPFCGSGTVLAEAARLHLMATGCDINPAAILFASMHSFANTSLAFRREAIEDVRGYLGSPDKPSLFSSYRNYHPSEAIQQLHGLNRSLYAVSLMLAMGDQPNYDSLKHEAAFTCVAKSVLNMPVSERPVTAEANDARTLSVTDHSVNLVVTSPPYINVFNYHQNYRLPLELMGWKPLSVAAAEIGSNRKNRQNRLLTVVQYCIDIALTLGELKRVVKPDGCVVFIVGRCSSVRGISFKNGLLIALLAEISSCLKIEEWRERRFLNRFGEDISEDILTLRTNIENADTVDMVSIGRAVGLWALERAYDGAVGDVSSDVLAAIEKVPSIMPSPAVSLAQPSAPHSNAPTGMEMAIA